MGKKDTKLLEKKDGQRYPVIQTTPSFFEQIENSFGDVSTNLSKTLDGTQEILNEENQKQIGIILNRSARFMNKLETLLDKNTINHFHSTMKNFDNASSKLDAMMPKIELFVVNSVEWENKISTNFQEIMNSYVGIKETMDHFRESLVSGDFNIKEITSDIVPTLNNTLLETQNMIIRLDALMEQYEKSPADILYKTQKINKGPGE
jgi:phospholipid/cholesterol/gamma-HCH transport system substrate-binding protein